jgi:uncharacterized protein YodC (DUF2158 family)
MNPRYRIGDVVRLKSGGPFLTVKGIIEASDATARVWGAPGDILQVIYFDGREIKERTIHSQLVERAAEQVAA